MNDAADNATAEAMAQKVAAVRSNRELLTELLEDEILLAMLATELGDLALIHAENDDMSWLDIGREAVQSLLDCPLDDNFGVTDESD